MVPVIYFVSKLKSDPSQYGFVQVGVYLIMLWSGERNFAVRLNKVRRGVMLGERTMSAVAAVLFFRSLACPHHFPPPLGFQEYDATIAIDDVPFKSGTHGDLVMLFIHSLLTAKSVNLSPLYECLLTAVANISPYLKSLGLLASNKLVHLVQVCGSALLAVAEGDCRSFSSRPHAPSAPCHRRCLRRASFCLPGRRTMFWCCTSSRPLTT